MAFFLHSKANSRFVNYNKEIIRMAHHHNDCRKHKHFSLFKTFGTFLCKSKQDYFNKDEQNLNKKKSLEEKLIISDRSKKRRNGIL